MANNKTTYTLEIDAEIGKLKKELDDARRALASLDGSNFAKGLDKKIDSIILALDKLSKKASQPIDSKSTFSGIEKGFGAAIVDAKSLLAELQKIYTLTDKDKISLLPEKEGKKLKEAIAAIAAYEKAVERAEKKRIKALEETKSRKSTAEAELETAKQELSQKKKYGDAQAIMQQAKAAEDAKKEIADLEKTLKSYKKELAELKKLESKTPDQEQRMGVLRDNISSVSGKIGARTRVVKKGPDESKIAEASQIIAEQGPIIEQFDEEIAAVEKRVAQLAEAITTLNKRIADNSDEITLSQSDYKVFYEQARKLGVSLEGVSESADPQSIRLLTDRLNDMVANGIKPVEDAINGANPALMQFGEIAEKAGEKTRQAENSFSALADNNNRINNLKQTIAQFVGWTGTTKALNAALRSAFASIKELDAAMTEIAVVTNFDIGDMWDQMPTYTKRANELGISITDAYEASALFYQQGLDTNEMIELSNETLKMARVAGLDAAEATDRMTAALRGFNMELDQASAQKVADVYTELAAITASDVDEISKAMTKTASIASSAGMSFETTAAFLSQIIETTRESAETAGTAMKTVIARFQELKKAPDEIGEIDGEIVDANQIETALRSVGVSLRDAGGQFRELDEVFLELSSKWNTLDKNTQRYIATIAAGSRQQSRFIAMMQDYERTQELVTAANNSAGASQKQYEKTLDSIKTKLARLENAWTEFSTGLMNSDVVKFAVDFLTSILNTINKVTKGFGSLTSSLSKVGTLIAIFETAKIIVSKFFDDTIETVYKSAVKAGEKIAEGTEAGINKASKTSEQSRSILGIREVKSGAQKIRDASAMTEEASHNRNALKYELKGIEDQAQFRFTKAQSAETWKKAYIDDLKAKRETQSGSAKGQLTRKINNAEKELLELTEERIQAENEFGAVKKENADLILEADNKVAKAEENALQLQRQGWESIAVGAQAAAQAVTLVGVGLGLVGQIFSDAGLEEVGEVVTTIGQGFALVGSAVTALVPMINLLGTTITVQGEAISVAGYLASLGWGPLLLIFGAIAATIAVVAIAMNEMKKASPEYKLEQAQKATDNAADAADRASKSYQNLRDSFEGLEKGYDELEDLTRGTEKWSDAVQKLNNEVLDLIQLYPELSEFVTSEKGVLTIDFDNPGVEKILQDAKINASAANNAYTLATLNATKVQTNNARNDLSKTVGSYQTTMGYTYSDSGMPVMTPQTTYIRDSKTTDALAKAIASGVIRDTGSEYKVEDADKLAEYGIKEEFLNDYYAQVGGITEELREFGKTLLEAEQQSKASFTSLAASAYSLADTLGFTEDDKEQASNLVDKATMKKLYDDEINQLAGDFTKTDKLKSDQQATLNEAIKAQYGSSARIENGKVTYYDGKDQKTVDLTNDEIKALIATQKSTKAGATAVEMAPATVNAVVDTLQKAGVANADVIEKATQDKEGGALTKAEKDAMLGMDETELRKAYQGLSDAQKAVFGTEEDFIDKTLGAAKLADGAFKKAEERANKLNITLADFMTADMATGFTTKMEEVFSISGQAGVDSIMSAYNYLIEGIEDSDIQGEITAMMNSIDWTNSDQILSLQIQLAEKYPELKDKIVPLTNAMKTATRATSELTASQQAFGELYKAIERSNAALQKMTKLQWEYERALKNGAKSADLMKNREEYVQATVDNIYALMDSYSIAMENMQEDWATGFDIKTATGKTAADYVKYDNTTERWDFSGLNDLITAELVDKEAALEYTELLEKSNDTAQDHLKAARDAYVDLEDIKEQEEESYWTLYEMIGELIITEMEKQLEVQQGILNATETANEKLLDKMQEQIDAERQQRENDEAKNNILDLRKKAAYLGMDSSGSNALALLDLEKQISEAEQDYQDSLIDQSLQKLQDANEKAAEQRERQISLAESQLESYKNSTEYQSEITKQLDEFMAAYDEAEENNLNFMDTQMGKRFQKGFTDGMTEKEKTTFWEDLSINVARTKSYLGGGTEESASNVLSKMDSIMYKIEGNADAQTRKNWSDQEGIQATHGIPFMPPPKTIEGVEEYEKKNSSSINFIKANKEEPYSKEKYESIINTGSTPLTQEEYYNKYAEKIATYNTMSDDTKKASLYSSYISAFYNKINSEEYKSGVKTSLIDNQGWDQNGAIGARIRWFNGNAGDNFKLWLYDQNGESNKYKVKASSDLGDSTQSGLTELWNSTHTSAMVASGTDGADGKHAVVNGGNLYIRQGGGQWFKVVNRDDSQATAPAKYASDYRAYYMKNEFPNGLVQSPYALKDFDYQYKTGGLADFTGPAWLDGTPSKPEYVLNAAQTERFFSLVNILENYDADKSKQAPSGDNYFEIEINVEKIDNDYDVEQIADKIRRMIYEDATYRNVNTINRLR